MNEAKTEKKKNKSTGRLAQHYLCAACGFDFPATGVQVDHIDPVVNPNKGFTTWDEYIERMFCGKENFQILCAPCHKEKTKKEKELTNANRSKD